MPSSFTTTVATPTKCPGRAAPSSGTAIVPGVTRVWSPGGYISSSEGTKTAARPLDVREVPLVQRTHRRDEADTMLVRAPAADLAGGPQDLQRARAALYSGIVAIGGSSAAAM